MRIKTETMKVVRPPRPTGRPKVPGSPPMTRPKMAPKAGPRPKFKFDIPTRDKFKKM